MILWSDVFEYFKDRRGPAVFLVALFLFFVVMLIGVSVFHGVSLEDLKQHWLFILTSALGLLAAIIWAALREVRARARNRYKSSPLSRDELRKARSKLTGTTNRIL